jgi:hypothetical protein
MVRTQQQGRHDAKAVCVRLQLRHCVCVCVNPGCWGWVTQQQSSGGSMHVVAGQRVCVLRN